MIRRTAPVFILLLGLISLASESGWASREYFTPQQKEQLAKVQAVRVEAIALTDKGAVNARPFADIASRGLSELGYAVVTDESKPHDAVFKVKCEQRKTWEGTTSMGGDADLPDSPSRIWKGPACQMSYVLGSLKIKWQKEVRTSFEDAVDAAKKANVADPGDFAMEQLKELLGRYDFPVLLAAEWGHADRLLKVLDTQGASQLRKLKVISLLGDLMSDEALPMLKEALKDKDLAKQAAVALGNIGRDGIPLLINILKTSNQIELQAAAAKGLGQVGGLHGDPTIVPPLLEKLQDPQTDWAVLTEVAWALGKMPDKRSIEPLYALDRKLQAMRDPDNMALKKLKEAVFWSIKQCDTWDQYS